MLDTQQKNPKGAGRPPRFKERMIPLNKRVPEQLKSKLLKMIDAEIDNYETLTK